jgi:hypothetical protein
MCIPKSDEQILATKLKEYEALRSEILKRIDMRQNIIYITLVVAGAFLSGGLLQMDKDKVAFAGPSVSFIYPPIAACLALAWVQVDYRIRDLSHYVRVYLEKYTPGLWWETYLAVIRKKCKKFERNSWRNLVLAHGGVFLLTQIMALIIGFATFKCDLLYFSLLGFDIIMLIFVIWIFKNLLSTNVYPDIEYPGSDRTGWKETPDESQLLPPERE